jgi:hypothetical protein
MYGLRKQAEYMNAPAGRYHHQKHLRLRGRLYMKLSMKALAMVLGPVADTWLDAAACQDRYRAKATSFCSAHFRMARLVNSVPLSLTMQAGLP